MTFTSYMVYSEVICLYHIQCLVFGITYDTVTFYYHRCKELRVFPWLCIFHSMHALGNTSSMTCWMG